MRTLISVFCFLLVVSSGSIFGVSVLRRRFSEYLPITCGAVVLLLFVAGLAGVLKEGAWLVLVAAIGLIVYSAVYMMVHQDVSGTIRRLFGADTVIFAIVLLLFLYGGAGIEASGFDEFSHWMDTVKSMVLLDDFGTNPLANTIYPDYPPGMSLFQYLMEKISILLGRGGFSEWLSLYAYKVLLVSMIAPLFRGVRYSKPFSMLFALLSILIVPGIFYDTFYHVSFIDPFLGVMSGIGLAYLITYSDETEQVVRTLSVCSASILVVLTKDAGILFGVMLVAGVVVTERIMFKASRHFAWRPCMAVAAAVALPKISWLLHLRARNVTQAFHNPISVRVLLDVLLNRDTSWRQGSWNRFFHELFQEKIVVGPFEVGVSYVVYFLLCLGFSILLLHWLKGVQEGSVRYERAVVWVAAIQLILYTVGIAVAYLFQFGEYEGSYHAGFHRYLRVTYLGLSMVILAMAMKIFTAEKASPRTESVVAISLSVLLLLMPVKALKNYFSRDDVRRTYMIRYENDELIRKLHTITKDGKAWFIAQQDLENGYKYYRFKFCAKPVQIQRNRWSLGDAPRFENDFYEYDVTADEWMDLLCKEYDYVVLYMVDDYFRNTYGGLFDEAEAIQDGEIYRVDRETRELELVSLES